ncbi:unnamed protein product [Boreogadus saida]
MARGVGRCLSGLWGTEDGGRCKEKVTLKKRDQAKTGAGMPEVKPLTVLEEKILATMGQVYTQGISTGTEVGLPEEILENVSAEVSDSTEEVILTLMEAECDSRAKKKKHLSLQEELLELEKEKLLVVSGSSTSLCTIMYAIMAFLLIFNHGRDVLRVREISNPAYAYAYATQQWPSRTSLLSQGNIEDIPHSYHGISIYNIKS